MSKQRTLVESDGTKLLRATIRYPTKTTDYISRIVAFDLKKRQCRENPYLSFTGSKSLVKPLRTIKEQSTKETYFKKFENTFHWKRQKILLSIIKSAVSCVGVCLCKRSVNNEQLTRRIWSFVYTIRVTPLNDNIACTLLFVFYFASSVPNIPSGSIETVD